MKYQETIIETNTRANFSEPRAVADNLYAGSVWYTPVRRKKKRLLVKKGIENIALPFENIVLVYTQNKLAYVMDKFLVKYMADKNLSELENELDPALFFRVNRQYIINIMFIASFKSFEKVKLLININIPEIKHIIVVSQETAPLFRKWMEEA